MLFHYTTLSTLAQILKNNRIRFSRIENVRDTSEIDVLREILIDSLRNINPEILGQSPDLIVSQCIEQRKNSYVFCLTITNKNEYLWKEYADNGNGVCIQFDPAYFPSTCLHSGIDGSINDIFTRCKMIYSRQEYIATIQWLVDNHDPSSIPFLLAADSDLYKDGKCIKECEERVIIMNQAFLPNCDNQIQHQDNDDISFKIELVKGYLFYLPFFHKNAGRQINIDEFITNIYIKSNSSRNSVIQTLSDENLNIKVTVL